jgi:hypothetical protein
MRRHRNGLKRWFTTSMVTFPTQHILYFLYIYYELASLEFQKNGLLHSLYCMPNVHSIKAAAAEPTRARMLRLLEAPELRSKESLLAIWKLTSKSPEAASSA